MKKYKSLILLVLALIIVSSLFYCLVPSNINLEYLGEISLGFDRSAYLDNTETTPVGWSGNYYCEADKPSTYQPYEIHNILEEYMSENHEDKINYIYSWGKPIKRLSYLRYSKYVPKESIGNYIGTKSSYLTKTIFDSAKIENKLYVYRIKDIELHSLYEGCVDEYADIYISNGFGYDIVECPYNELYEEMKLVH